ncbi:MAG TPA: hypothetical protein PLU37_13330 [Chitinophagaceae bacterium]|nr:hypothetical protein [Chitinophagaceae bacterium]
MRKKFTPVLIVIVFLVFGCSKDFLKKYEKRIIGGEWKITDLKRRGFGGNTASLPFQEGGRFNFQGGGIVTFTDNSGNVYTGNWDITKKRFDDDTWRSLEVSVADFNNQQFLFENYDDMQFSGTNHFKATIYSGAHSYITHFRR